MVLWCTASVNVFKCSHTMHVFLVHSLEHSLILFAQCAIHHSELVTKHAYDTTFVLQDEVLREMSPNITVGHNNVYKSHCF